MDTTEDPQYLCDLAVCLHNLYPPRRKVEEPPLRSGDSKRAAAVLDSLARLLVSEDKGQTVAVAAGLDDTGHIQLYVAENATTVSPRTVSHLRDICTRLIDIRAAIQASPDPAAILQKVYSPLHLATDPAEPVFVSLRALQLSLYGHSIRRIRARFTKDRWPERLQFALACIQGAPANTRDDLSEDEQDALEKLQDSETVRTTANEIGGAVQRIQDSIDQGSNDDLLKKVHFACMRLALAIGAHELDDHMVHFNRFILAYATRIGEPPVKHPDLAKWLKKVSFVITEYRNLVTILTKPALSAMFGDHVGIHPIDNEPPRKAFVAKLEVDNILTTFDALGFNSGNFKDIHALAAEIAEAASLSTQAGLVHCECALLCRLDQLGRSILPYIAVSKASCVFCDTFFACYREDRGSELRILGTHGKRAAWRWPDLPDDGPMKAMFCKKLRGDIKDRLSTANWERRPWKDSMDSWTADDVSQSTRPLQVTGNAWLTIRADFAWASEALMNM